MHSHTTYCDGKNTPLEMVESAYKKGFISFGFSGHSHLPYKAGYEMKMEKEAEYRKEVIALKKEFEGKMEVLLGLELDSDSVSPDFKYDFLISSVHQLHVGDDWYAVDHCKEDFNKCLKAFGSIENMLKEFYSVTASAALRENIDIVGHIDLVGKFNETNEYFNPNDEWYLKLVFECIDTILEKRPDIVFEVNTGAISRGYRTTPYPDLSVLKYLAKKGAKIMLNSDTHAADTLDFAYDIAIKHIKSAGINKIYRLRKFGFEEIEL
jgi:histidinol-phosphatase (PHP family)